MHYFIIQGNKRTSLGLVETQNEKCPLPHDDVINLLSNKRGQIEKIVSFHLHKIVADTRI